MANIAPGKTFGAWTGLGGVLGAPDSYKPLRGRLVAVARMLGRLGEYWSMCKTCNNYSLIHTGAGLN